MLAGKHRKTGPRIVFGNAKISPASEAIHAEDIKLRRIHEIILQSGGESVSGNTFSYFEAVLKSTELDIKAAEGSIGNYASLIVKRITKKEGSPSGEVGTLVEVSSTGSHTMQFIAFGD